MARPKQGEGIPARQRLEEAFWQLLAEQPYQDLTISALSRRAKVNHNTFYYYFTSLDDMAAELLDANMLYDLPARVFGAFAAGNLDGAALTADPTVMTRFRRIALMVGPHGASWQKDALKARVMEVWLATLGVEKGQLSDRDEVLLGFILGGLLTIVGEYDQAGDPALFAHLIDSPLGRGVLATVTQIAPA
jgi:AcrR family transcriptional regulator